MGKLSQPALSSSDRVDGCVVEIKRAEEARVLLCGQKKLVYWVGVLRKVEQGGLLS